MNIICGYGAPQKPARTSNLLFNRGGTTPLSVSGSGVGSILSHAGGAMTRTLSATTETMNTALRRVDGTVRESIQLNPSSGKDRVQDVPVPGTVGEMIGDGTSPKDETAVDALCDFGLSVARRQQMWDSCPAFRQKVPSPEVLKVRTDSTRFINAGWFDHYFD